jgi:hypothetical protein
MDEWLRANAGPNASTARRRAVDAVFGWGPVGWRREGRRWHIAAEGAWDFGRVRPMWRAG